MPSADDTANPADVLEGCVVLMSCTGDETARNALPSVHTGADVVEVPRMHDLTPSMIDAADVILSPLVAPSFDAVELASRLQDAEFGGKYLILNAKVASHRMIRDELRTVAPRLTVSFLSPKQRLN